MASVLWLGESLHQPELLSPLLRLPVRHYVLPWEDDLAERLVQPDFDEKVTGVTAAGERFFWHLPLCTQQLLLTLGGFDLYFLMVENFSDASKAIAAGNGRRLALGTTPPPEPVKFRQTSAEELFSTLCKELPSLEPAVFYINGGRVCASIEDEDFSAVLERMRGR